MPFTFSHPAIVLPLLWLPKKWRSATGLIVGSMTPDFEKFIRMSEFDPYSHTWRSIFYFNLPLGLVLSFVFHALVRDALIRHLPIALYQRFTPFISFNWLAHFRKNYLIIIVSLLLGTVSHLVWDSFTHPEGRGVRYFPFLLHYTFGGALDMRLYSFLQKLGSVVGVLALVWYTLHLHRYRETGIKRNQLSYWILVFLVAIGVVVIRLQLSESILLQNLYHLTIILISGGLTSLATVPLLLRGWQVAKPRSLNNDYHSDDGDI
ncbi:DUF4184 family protein [Hymenobacter taeanensis]|uniref:DUF4184 family protein n=1 Tax=Hymenobacter taeanensis TaxID=2735321 RepID=A0A6M6BKS8_9BACT|nr:DUF4184 family protein [Hymenobacter taeanensis]